MKDAVHVAHRPSPPYGFTGVIDRAWTEAARLVGRQYTESELESGWPLAMEPHRLANMQFPKDSAGQHFASTALLAACKKDQLQCNAFERHDYGLGPDGKWGLLSKWIDYAIAAKDFAAWLAQQDEKPSEHIAAWFKAVGVNTQPETTPEQTAATPAPVMVNSASSAPLDAPPPVATGDVAHAFAGLRGWDEKAWKDNLGSPSKWLQACIALRGQRGIREHHWNPVLIGAALVHNGHAKPHSIRARFQTKPQLAPWLEAWKTYEADNFDTP